MSETNKKKTCGMLDADKVVQSLCGQGFQINLIHHGLWITGRVRRNKEPSCAVTSLEVPIKCVVFGPATAAQEAERVAPDGPVVSPPHPGTGVSVFLGDPSTNVE